MCYGLIERREGPERLRGRRRLPMCGRERVRERGSMRHDNNDDDALLCNELSGRRLV
jgi:hypothetical protein